jgi:hypothetical protein
VLVVTALLVAVAVEVVLLMLMLMEEQELVALVVQAVLARRQLQFTDKDNHGNKMDRVQHIRQYY